jgi:steroid delta-isomerase-like uncharacterized protein
MPNDPGTEALIRAYVEAAASRDLERVWTFYSEDIVYEDCALRQIHRGIEATKKFYIETMTGLDVAWIVDTIVATDESYGVAGQMSGTHSHDLPGMPATGRAFSVPCASIGEVRDGKIIHNRDFWNNHDLLKQLGFLSHHSSPDPAALPSV